MRNSEIINAISAKLAAVISDATGTTVPALTAEEMDNTSLRPLAPYQDALTPAALNALTGDRDEAFLAGEAHDIDEVLVDFSLYVKSSRHPATDERVADEDSYLDGIPTAYRADLAPGADPAKAEEELAAAFSDPDVINNPFRREIAERSIAEVSARFIPADFVPEGSGAGADAERTLAGWAALRDRRDDLVRAALAAGVSKTRIQEITRISRATINRLLDA